MVICKKVYLREMPVWGMSICTFLVFFIFDILCGIETQYFGYIFTLRSTWAFLLFFTLLFSMPALVWNLRKTQAAIITLLALWMWAALIYFRQFHTIIPLSAYSQVFAATANYGNNIAALMRWVDLLFLIPVIVAWYLAGLWKGSFRPRRILYFSLLGLTFILSWGVSLAEYGFEGTFRAIGYRHYEIRPAQFTPAGLLIHQAITRLMPISGQDTELYNRWQEEHRNLFPQHSVGVNNRDKVIILLVESLDSWVVKAEVEGQKVMPFLNSLTDDSTALYVPKVVGQTRDGESSDGQYILLTGTLPLSSGAISLEHPDAIDYSLAKAFAEQYKTSPRYYDCSPRQTWNKEVTIPGFGFNEILFKEDFPSVTGDEAEVRLRDGKMISYIIDEMQRNPYFGADKPWFVELVTASSHYDYILPPGEVSSLNLKEKYPDILERYMKVMRYVDDNIARLVQYIQSRPDSERISIVITADHPAPSISKHISAGEGSEPLIPLLVLNSPKPGIYEGYAAQSDIYPTLLDLFCPRYPNRGLGVSIFNPAHPGMAAGSDGKVYGNGAQEMSRHLQDAFTVSDLILRYDLPVKK